MFELIAVGSDPRQRLRCPLAAGETYHLGRGLETDLPIPWDPYISRRHVELKPAGECVEVSRLPETANPLFFEGRTVESCRVRSGEHFVLGSTSFRVRRLQAGLQSPSERTIEEVTFEPRELEKVRFRDADKRIDVLSRLPEVIWGARTDSEFYDRLISLILAGVPRSDAVGIVKPNRDDPDAIELLHWDRRRETAGEFRASSRLVSDTLDRRRRTILHVWEPHRADTDDYTEVAEFDWAFCTPVDRRDGDPWGIYVAGRLERAHDGSGVSASDSDRLQADVKFTELVAEIVRSVQRLKNLQQRQAGLRQFFAPAVLSALEDDPGLLEPRECDVTVLFCDLRGFSHHAEESADDLLGFLERVSLALGVMREQIMKYGGVTGDFQGDAALGFWGWPFASDEAPRNACRAALGIRAEFEKTSGQKNHPLGDFETGIGIAHGRAVAGKIGTAEQVKITVFGPVVNLASRLESMTRRLRVPIVIDETMAQIVRSRLDPSEGRTRYLAKVQPYGMEIPAMVSELLPPESEFPELTDHLLAEYDRGVRHFIEGDWEQSYRCLHEMPPADRAHDFLQAIITQHNRVAPRDWNGIVHLRHR